MRERFGDKLTRQVGSCHRFVARLCSTLRGLKQRVAFIVAIPILLAAASVSHGNVVIAEIFEEPALVGSGDYRAMFWDVYRAELYASNGEYTPDEKHALRLVYKRPLRGKAIVDKSIELIERQGFDDELKLAEWHEQLIAVIPDVEKDTEIVGVFETQFGAEFYVNGEFSGAIEDPSFAELFFGIWLSESTISPRLRSALLGLER